MADVFISYKREDRDLAERVVTAVEAAGYTTWWDEHITPREAWDSEIQHQIAAAPAVLVLWTERSVKSDWVRAEAHYAKERKKLVPARLGACEPWVPFNLVETADLLNWDGEEEHPQWLRVVAWIADLVRAFDQQETAKRAREASHRLSWDTRKARQVASLASRLKTGTLWRDAVPGLPEAAAPLMVTIPSGHLIMGSPKEEVGHRDDEEPRHEVRIGYAFALGKHPVTFAEWDAALSVGAKLPRPEDEGWGRDRRPVINVSWVDAQDYLAWLNDRLGLVGRSDAYRLPSEAEWEYACRAGTSTPYAFGEKINNRQAQYSEEQGKAGMTDPVGFHATNAFGLCDMHGNVYEWCADGWCTNYVDAPADGSAWHSDDSERVVRGGSWRSEPHRVRSASRHHHSRDYRWNRGGFRVAKTL
jgi:formylglycine-generating enzyme required for sulfatase activity